MKNRTRKAGLIISCLCITLYSNAQIKGDSFKQASTTKDVKLTYVYNDVTDFAKKNENGKVEGILVDLMKEFESFVKAKHNLNIKGNFVQIEGNDFNLFLQQVKEGTGGVFGLSNTSITQARRKDFTFSHPFMNNISVLITNKSVSDLSLLESISRNFGSMTAYSVPSSTYLARLERMKKDYFPAMKIQLLSSGQEVIERVAKDTNSFAVVDLMYYMEYYKKGYPVKRHKVGDEYDE